MPGNTNENHIIYGISTYWTNDKKLKYKIYTQCGEYYDKQDLSVAYNFYIHNNANSAHMTIVFNVFVVYTLFNQINCRVIDDSLNIFVRIGKNLFFPIITCGELFLQIILIQFGGDAFKCTEKGITKIQWLICIGFSLTTLLLSIIVKFIPFDIFIQKILDNFSKENKIAGAEDLRKKKENEFNEKKNIDEKNEEKNDLNKSVNSKGSKLTKQDNLTEEINGSLIKALRRSSNTNSGGGSLRQQKPDIIIAYD